MRHVIVFASIASLGLLTACSSSPEERAAKAKQRSYEAYEEVARERLRLVDLYRDWVTDAGADAVKVEACDSYLRAAEALK